MTHYSGLPIDAPTGWALEFDKKQSFDNPAKPQGEWIDDTEHPKLTRGGSFAGRCTNYDAVHKIELRHHFNGSGKSAFGGAEAWPYIEAGIAFNSGEEALAIEFAEELGIFIQRWMTDHKR